MKTLIVENLCLVGGWEKDKRWYLWDLNWWHVGKKSYLFFAGTIIGLVHVIACGSVWTPIIYTSSHRGQARWTFLVKSKHETLFKSLFFRLSVLEDICSVVSAGPNAGILTFLSQDLLKLCKRLLLLGDEVSSRIIISSAIIIITRKISNILCKVLAAVVINR